MTVLTPDDPPDDPLAPRKNPELLGHQEAEGVLADAFGSGRLAHAWLISGPAGIGKATLAYRFARFVLAGGGDGTGAGPDLFGTDGGADPGSPLYLAPGHPVFRRVASGGHVDLKVVVCTVNEKTGKLRTEIIVDDVRSVSQFFSLTAGEGGWRVAIIDKADEMNPHAANALLKILEEPPQRSLLLLLSDNPGRLLPTLRSRCRKLALQPLSGDLVASLTAASLPGMDAGDAPLLARLAQGSPGRAMALAAEGGLDLYRDMTGLLATLPKLDVGAVHAFGTRLGKSGAGDSFQLAGVLLRWWLARLIRSAAGGGDGTGAEAGFPAEEEALMGRLGPAAGLDRWLEVWEKINHLLARTDSARLDRKQVVLNVFLTLENAVRS